MAFERIEFIEEAILSALKQVTKNQKIKINLIISDNSISNTVEFFIKKNFQNYNILEDMDSMLLSITISL